MRREVFQQKIETAARQLSSGKVQNPGTNLLPAPELAPRDVEKFQRLLQIKDGFVHINKNLWAVVTEITPEMVLEWLTELNKDNRGPWPSQLQALVQDIKDGSWSLTHQGFAFEVCQGDLIFRDGQHRAYAILEAGQPVLSMVVLNIPGTAMSVIDRHRSRRARDRLNFLGGQMSPFHEACIRRCMLGSDLGTGTLTIPQIEQFLEQHRGRLEWAVGQFAVPQRVRGITHAPMVAAVFRASFHNEEPEQTERLEAFTRAVVGGRIMDDGDSAVLTLRNALIGKSQQGVKGHALYLKIVRALDAFLKRQPLQRLYEASTDLFPLPKPVEADSLAGNGEMEEDAV